jgi:uncharacterized protein (DUF302 family)
MRPEGEPGQPRAASGVPSASPSAPTVRPEASVHRLKGEMAVMATKVIPGLRSKRSRGSVDETLQRLERVLRATDIVVFAIVDHSGEAERVGLTMPPTKLVVFGSPRAGTPLMLAAPSVAIDLPMKMLIWEDGEGCAWVSYNTAAYLQERHEVPAELLQPVSGLDALADAIAA